MGVRVIVDIPRRLHDKLRRRVECSGASIRALIIRAVEQAYDEPKKAVCVTGPMITGRGKLGPAFPRDRNPHEFVFSESGAGRLRPAPIDFTADQK